MKYRNLLLIVLVVLLVGGVTAIVSSSKKTDDVPAGLNQSDTANVTAKNVEFTITEGELKKWLITAEEAEYFQDRTGAKLFNIKGEVFDDAGKVIVVFHAPKGEFVNQSSQVKLSGGVQANTQDEKNPVTVTAPTMQWSTKSKQVLATGGVKLTHHTFGQSNAASCRFNLDLTAMSLEGGVVTEVSL